MPKRRFDNGKSFKQIAKALHIPTDNELPTGGDCNWTAMPNNILHTLSLPPYSSLKEHEGKGNYAISKYYKFPYRIFYRHKLKMIINLMEGRYKNCLDYGAGPGIFTRELKKHCDNVISHDFNKPVDLRWKFDLIICASVLEFCHLNATLEFLKGVLKPGGTLIVASPMETPLSKYYFKAIEDMNIRYSHTKIIEAIQKKFKVEKKKEWLGLYFALRAKK